MVTTISDNGRKTTPLEMVPLKTIVSPVRLRYSAQAELAQWVEHIATNLKGLSLKVKGRKVHYQQGCKTHGSKDGTLRKLGERPGVSFGFSFPCELLWLPARAAAFSSSSQGA